MPAPPPRLAAVDHPAPRPSPRDNTLAPRRPVAPPAHALQSQDVKFVTFHPSKDQLISASFDDTIKIWDEDGDDWFCAETLEAHASTVWCVAIGAAASASYAAPSSAMEIENENEIEARCVRADRGGGPRFAVSFLCLAFSLFPVVSG